MKRIKMHAEARRELFKAAEHYDKIFVGGGKRLRLEVARIRERIRTAPLQGSPYLYGTRRFILKRFPFSSVYLTLETNGYVVAVAHHKRRPGYWRRRLRDIH